MKKAITTLKGMLPEISMSALSAWLICLCICASTQETPFFTTTTATTVAYADLISPVYFILGCFALFIPIFLLSHFLSNKIALFLLPVAFTAYGSISVTALGDIRQRGLLAIIFTALAIPVVVSCVRYAKRKEISFVSKKGKDDLPLSLSLIIVSTAFVLFSAFFIYILWHRTYSYCSPNFDMGIFAQMLDNLAEKGVPETTCERGNLLSHFAVHFSPILYLLIPFAWIFKSLDVLIFAQVLVPFSAVFPIFLICRKKGLKNIHGVLFSLLFLLYPAMSSGGFYDFHENAFLTPLIIWALYFIEIEKYIPAFAFALGVLMVKEDAALYVGFISLYVFFGKKKYLKASLMLLMTVLYFLFALFMLKTFGEGNMLGSRYDNIVGDGGFTDLIRVFLVNPALYAKEVIVAKNDLFSTPPQLWDKLLYICAMLLPLGFLPLLTNRISRFLLICPMLVINLLSQWIYQYDLTFQYSFGSGALLFFLAVINFADIYSLKTDIHEEKTFSEDAEIAEDTIAEEIATKTPKKPLSVFAVIALSFLSLSIISSTFFMSYRLPSQTYYVKYYNAIEDQRKIIDEVLDGIDRSKSISASSMFLTHLYDADELYQTGQGQTFIKDGADYKMLVKPDILVIDARGKAKDNQDLSYMYYAKAEEGYEVVIEHTNLIIVLERTDKTN